MRAVKERSQVMLEIPCRCGGHARQQIGNVEHYVGQKKIVVKNIPHYYCEDCKTYSYGTNVNVSNLLKDAVVKGLSEVNYN